MLVPLEDIFFGRYLVASFGLPVCSERFDLCCQIPLMVLRHVDALSVLLPHADWAVLNEPFRKGAPSVLFVSSGMGNFEATRLLVEARAEVNLAS